jgi:hypothetical protein
MGRGKNIMIYLLKFVKLRIINGKGYGYEARIV